MHCENAKERSGGEMTILGLLSIVFQLCIFVGLGIEILGIKTLNKKYIKVGFVTFTFGSLILGVSLIVFGFYELQFLGIVILGLGVSNTLYVHHQMNKSVVILTVCGEKIDLERFFAPDIEKGSIQRETIKNVPKNEGIGRFMFTMEKEPEFKMNSNMKLDLSPKDAEGKWRLVVYTGFGVKERSIFDFLKNFRLWKNEDEVYYHKDFKQGKVLVHLFDFLPSNWKVAE